MGLLDQIRFKRGATAPPESIEINDRNEFLVAWQGTLAVIPSLRLRDGCPCAECIEEGTGRKLLKTDSIPQDIRALEVKPVGNYAVQIRWSDGHGSGIYSWDTLRRLSGLEPEAGAPLR